MHALILQHILSIIVASHATFFLLKPLYWDAFYDKRVLSVFARYSFAPKNKELTAASYRLENTDDAKQFFEDGMVVSLLMNEFMTLML